MSVSRANKMKYRILAVEALRATRRLLSLSYRQLARETDFDATLLARYSTGISVPSYEQAMVLMKALRKVLDPTKLALIRAGDLRGFLDLTTILSDPYMLKIISIEFYERFKGRDMNKVLVPETSGISLATAMALTFDVPLVIARKVKDNPVIEYIEEHVVEPPTIRNIFYIPQGSLNKGDGVLIVDDIVQTGLTLAVMKRFVERVKARVKGVAAIVVIGDEWRRRAGINDIEALIRISKT